MPTENTPPVFDEPKTVKKRFVNRNSNLAAAAKIINILEKVDQLNRAAVLSIVNSAMPSVIAAPSPATLFDGEKP